MGKVILLFFAIGVLVVLYEKHPEVLGWLCGGSAFVGAAWLGMKLTRVFPAPARSTSAKSQDNVADRIERQVRRELEEERRYEAWEAEQNEIDEARMDAESEAAWAREWEEERRAAALPADAPPFTTSLSGLSKPNTNGTSRRDMATGLAAGEPLTLHYDEEADEVEVLRLDGRQIGVLNRQRNRQLSWPMKSGEPFLASAKRVRMLESGDLRITVEIRRG